ncbi:tetratricopeptide repeat protein [Lewinella sp. IMCC34183]|uniref:tetratricopeptide repeat protein n=1 Tax=Lewinella sp. IMCC34183 TaxID=2248762 RepID=UPI000E21EA22|nr:hypothetical protein [Lewinella sp. IMCC34183]
MQDGRLLAELRQHYGTYLSDYLDWAEERGYPEANTLLNYRRALIGWYEARLREERPYAGDVYPYLTTVAERYFGGTADAVAEEFPLGDEPLAYLPEPVHLDARGQQLLAALKADADCRDLLLLADYHQMEAGAIARALDREGEIDELSDQIDACRYDLEASVPGGALLYRPALRVAGRQDLMETLGREEPEQEEDPAPAPAPETADVRLSPRRRRRTLGLPTPAIVVAGLLTGVLLYLLYDTFYANAAPEGLYADFFDPYPNVFETTPPATSEERDLERILYYYDRGDYRTAYDELLPTADAYPAAPLYLGVTALELGDPTRAREWLARVEDPGPYAAPAAWYRALALLAAGDRARATGLLRGIAGEADHPYADRARELLGAL